MASATVDSIKVAVRMRPLIQREEDQKCELLWGVSEDSKSLYQLDNLQKSYTFDQVFGADASTESIFKELIMPILDDVMNGINGTVIAYGQTTSGKTHTMMGNADAPGIIPLCINEIYNFIENTPDREFLIRVSYMEIFNETVVDLLGNVKKNLNLLKNTDGDVVVKDLEEVVVMDTMATIDQMKRGELARHYDATLINEKSSRSHSIFRVIVESRERVDDHRESFDGAVMIAHLNLVDLAGSEKLSQTGATGQRLMEGNNINTSLSTLSRVINQLSINARYVSYRDSKLTHILQNSLGANSKTTIICAVTPAAFEETHSTLRFATSAKHIKNKPIVNETMSDRALMKQMQQEIAKLTQELERNLSQSVQLEKKELEQKLAMEREEKEQLLKLNEEKERLVRDQNEKIERLTNIICVSSQLKPENQEVAKKKRRETWCPGKGMSRLSMAPLSVAPLFPSFDKPGLRTELSCCKRQSASRQPPDGEDFYEIMKEELIKKAAEINLLKSDLEEKKTTIQSLQMENSQKDKAITDLRSAVKTKNLKSSNGDNDTMLQLEAENEGLKQQLSESLAINEELRNQVAMLEAEKADLQEKLSSLKSEHELLLGEFKELEEFTRYEELKDTSIVENQPAIDAQDKPIDQQDQIQAQPDQLQMEMVEKQAELDRVEAEIAQAEVELGQQQIADKTRSSDMKKETIQRPRRWVFKTRAKKADNNLPSTSADDNLLILNGDEEEFPGSSTSSEEDDEELFIPKNCEIFKKILQKGEGLRRSGLN